MFRRSRTLAASTIVVAILVASGIAVDVNIAGADSALSVAHPMPSAYTNPLPLELADGLLALNCGNPFVMKGPQAGDRRWYLYCTGGELNPGNPNGEGGPGIAILPMYSSLDLVHWSYAGNALPAAPNWVGGGALWAPDVVYQDGRYLLYYTASDTVGPNGAPTGGGSAIGVLTSTTPLGPWTDSGKPVVPPEISTYPGATQRTVYDPEVITTEGHSYVYYGSYIGGISVRELSPDGLTSIPSTERRIALDNRYEGTFIVRHDGWYYFMGSATNCCNGSLTGYAVFAGRSRSPFGPFLDRDGVSLLATRVGGTPVLTQNGNLWVGPGHNSVITDYSGQQWIYYHAVDQNDPYLPGQVGATVHGLLMDPLDWVKGWPTVNGGAGPSESTHPGPAAQPGERPAYRPRVVRAPRPGERISALSDDFTGPALSPRWTWIRPPAADSYQVGGGTLAVATQDADLQPPAPNLASVLAEPAPRGDYMVQTTVRTNVPDDGSFHNYVQGGLVVYNDDGNYVKLAVTAMWDSRQTEYGKHVDPVPAGYPVYGNTVVGPVGQVTYLRIVHRWMPATGVDTYTAYTSIDGRHWDTGGTWDMPSGAETRIGLVSMGRAGYTSTFGPVTVSRLGW
ncbi:MAG TPA: family 43 glycosylhydrolase [Pseudonocardiaceae bacterium]|nr:family 43 glycosylhydrolase [Pseudonocardiaceae bacterium]